MKRLAEMSQRGHDINEKKIKGRGVKDVEKNNSYSNNLSNFSILSTPLP